MDDKNEQKRRYGSPLIIDSEKAIDSKEILRRMGNISESINRLEKELLSILQLLMGRE